LYKGPIPAGFGQTTSAVLDVGMKPGDMEEWHASGTIGILAAKASVSGPVVRDRLSVAVTARRSYVDMFLKIVPKYRDIVMHFYDLTGKVRYIPRKGDIIDVSAYASRDNMAIDDLMSMKWGNAGGSVQWLARRGDAWTFATSGSFTSYTATMGMTMMDTDQAMDECVRSGSLEAKITCVPTDGHTLEWGLRSELQNLLSAEWHVGPMSERELGSGIDNALWVSYSGAPASWLSIDGGARVSAYSTLGGRGLRKFSSLGTPGPDESHRVYWCAEPRLSLKFSPARDHSLRLGAGVSSQTLQSLRSSSTSMPFDRYVIASASVRPMSTIQYGAGYTGMTPDGAWEWSAEAYFKQMHHVCDYLDGRSMMSDICIENIIKAGRGRSLGAEFMLRKNSGRLNGWMSYTVSRTQTRIAGINGGRWYAASNDRRHRATVVAIYELSERWNLSATWTYSSGTPLTVPDVKYQLDGATCYYYSARNSYRTPASHHLDVAATYTHKGPRLTYQWALGVYNLYNHYNPFIIYFEDDPTKPSGTRAVQRSLYGIVPSVSYTLKF
ncbi:MAG: TonB-dependent receptor, partial [Muribaculaceae bacterium]|nr:TonB-dependent receptor [Muribaculaceae bacterium]